MPNVSTHQRVSPSVNTSADGSREDNRDGVSVQDTVQDAVAVAVARADDRAARRADGDDVAGAAAVAAAVAVEVAGEDGGGEEVLDLVGGRATDDNLLAELERVAIEDAVEDCVTVAVAGYGQLCLMPLQKECIPGANDQVAGLNVVSVEESVEDCVGVEVASTVSDVYAGHDLVVPRADDDVLLRELVPVEHSVQDCIGIEVAKFVSDMCFCYNIVSYPEPTTTPRSNRLPSATPSRMALASRTDDNVTRRGLDLVAVENAVEDGIGIEVAAYNQQDAGGTSWITDPEPMMTPASASASRGWTLTTLPSRTPSRIALPLPLLAAVSIRGHCTGGMCLPRAEDDASLSIGLARVDLDDIAIQDAVEDRVAITHADRDAPGLFVPRSVNATSRWSGRDGSCNAESGDDGLDLHGEEGCVDVRRLSKRTGIDVQAQLFETSERPKATMMRWLQRRNSTAVTLYTRAETSRPHFELRIETIHKPGDCATAAPGRDGSES
ncbi:hypothetical protein MRB53_040230 [Persea americana]|nr:hypothetical protein MRB53_040230 [Persea americana]